MMLDPLLLSRIQFAFVVAFHFLLPAFTIGLPLTSRRNPLIGRPPSGFRGPVAIESFNEMKLLVPTENPFHEL